MPANRLLGQASPYLLQHATNPVDWWPWSEEAFAEAGRRDVPVLVSVGYSACHWCHVMAHESFEDPAVARALNSGFVAVKVDREERPDVDAVYMEALQLVSGGGGWPMTVVALPDGRPFWLGTYLPRARFLELLGGVAQAWRERREAIEQDAQRLTEAVRRGGGLPAPPAGPAVAATPSAGSGSGPVGLTATALLANRDHEWGGRAGAPKFPQPASLEVLARHWWASGDESARQAWSLALDAMSSGGIYDHLGGGFARYSTDRRWLVPHFEKMLYDNALLVRAYVQAWQLTGADRYRQVVEETVAYLLSAPVHLPEGTWAAAEDADSEGEEGRFYTWSRSEVLEVAGPDLADWYGVTEEGNWEGRNVLWRPDRGELARPAHLEVARAALADRRAGRPRPALDDKVVTEWNAMVIGSLSLAGRALGRPAWVDAAQAGAGALCRLLQRPDGRWLRSWRAGQPGPPAYAADHAWLVDGFTRLYEATGRTEWAGRACGAADDLLRLFADPQAPGFFTSGTDGETLVARIKDVYDGATPSANAAAAAALTRLAHLTGDDRYRRPADRLVDAMAPSMDRSPTAFSALALVADELHRAPTEVVAPGDHPELVGPAFTRYLPGAVVAWGEPTDWPIFEGRRGPGSVGRAYVCQGYHCELPVSAPGEVARLLGPSDGPWPGRS